MDKNELAALRMNPSQEITLRPSKWKWVFILIFLAGGALIGLSMALGGKDSHGWVAFVIFGVLALFPLIQLFGGKSYLRLTATGLEVRTLFLAYDVPWNGVGNIGVIYYRRNVTVAFDYVNPASANSKRCRDNKRVLKYDQVIPETYRLDAQDLAELLASRRDAV